MKYFYQFCLLFVLTLSSLILVAQDIDPGEAYFQQGQFEKAVQYWTETLSHFSSEENPKRYVDMSVRLAMAYRSLGFFHKARDILQNVQSRAEKIDDSVYHVSVLSHLSDISLVEGDLQKAEKYLEKAEAEIAITKKAIHPLLSANILNKKGNVFMAQEKYTEALSAYRESVRLATQGNDRVLRAKTFINIVQATIQEGNYEQVKHQFDVALQMVKNDLLNSYDKAFALIGLAHLAQTLQVPSEVIGDLYLFHGVMIKKAPQPVPFKLSPKQKNELRLYIHKALMLALDVAKAQEYNRTIAYANGYLAQLYATVQQYDEAIQLTRRAIFYAQSYPELLYGWEWQLGRLLKEKNYPEAINIYRRAVKHLQQVRLGYYSILHAKPTRQSCQAVLDGKHHVSQPSQKVKKIHETVENLYLELADLLLWHATKAKAAEKQALLKEASTLSRLY